MKPERNFDTTDRKKSVKISELKSKKEWYEEVGVVLLKEFRRSPLSCARVAKWTRERHAIVHTALFGTAPPLFRTVLSGHGAGCWICGLCWWK